MAHVIENKETHIASQIGSGWQRFKSAAGIILPVSKASNTTEETDMDKKKVFDFIRANPNRKCV
jgi:hypothetical protein